MSLTARSFLSTMIWLALYGQAVAGETNVAQGNPNALEIPKGTCLAPEYRCLTKDEQSDDVNNAPITIVADSAEAKANEKSIYRGDVVVKQGHRTVRADEATLRQPENIVTAEGNVYYHDGDIAIKGKTLQTNLDNEDTTLTDINYQMMCEPGRGEAKRVFKNGTTFYELEDGTYTTCPEKDDSWRFVAGKIEKEDSDIFADLYNARFEVLDTPIFYLPYLRVPVEDGRLTGFLYPSVSWNDSDGFELETPFYWNIHPQADMLITPKYMSNRGLFMALEPRYLTKAGAGSMVMEYMGEDRLYPEYDKSWGFNWRHSGIQDHWKYDVDYSKVSDISYFSRHTDSRVGSREDNTLLQTGEVSYRDINWDSTLSVRNFQALSENTSVYRLLPQLAMNYYHQDLAYGFDFKMPFAVSKFATDDDSKPDALRVNIAPTFVLPYNLPWLSASAEGKLYYTYYDQSNIDGVTGINGEKLEETVSRVVPMAKLHAAVTLERNGTIFNEAYTQTLEPQVQYLYIHDVDQSGIYNPVNYAGGGYDTARLQTDYYGLFRANQFSSIDYINPANQFTVGAATRFFDDGFKERFNIAFGQIYYLDRPDNQGDTLVDYSAWAVESELNLYDNFFVRGSVEYDSNISNMQFGNATVEYRKNSFFAQTSYRYVAKNYIASTTGNEDLDQITEDGISQLGFVTGFPLTKNISVQGQYFHDLTQDLLLENQFGITYTSACWAIGLSYNKYLMSRSNINDPAQYDNNISLSFSLLGLGAGAGFGYSSANGNALGYTNPFGLRN
ncbi:LPS assembly protein LptD [Enterovibrio nigricans]|uniref:LPS-assembly protein LptD n=1 Tax=Enterovibrio nigricans DSM 22720 TaxID=1121868 RepID=A0A1T4U1Q0_9GAMM|nr:LPS assembly protein LptD [Enterovibrio nigricans]PKF51150.1 LPS assembly protein LptD [Enterovibrio nigricans]SKA46627.1 LPS-assembly protein [Enterovibrio nigricans DSM 22720]